MYDSFSDCVGPYHLPSILALLPVRDGQIVDTTDRYVLVDSHFPTPEHVLNIPGELVDFEQQQYFSFYLVEQAYDLLVPLLRMLHYH